MDWDSLGPLGVFLSTLAGGVVWVMNRIDKGKRARRDDALKAADERLAEKDADIAERDRKIALLEEELHLANSERHSYYWQLRDNKIKPEPGWREARYV